MSIKALRSPKPRLFVEKLALSNYKDIKALDVRGIHWWPQKASNMETVSMSWCHHEDSLTCWLHFYSAKPAAVWLFLGSSPTAAIRNLWKLVGQRWQIVVWCSKPRLDMWRACVGRRWTDADQGKWHILTLIFNSSPPGQNGRHFADNVFRCIFVNDVLYFENFTDVCC